MTARVEGVGESPSPCLAMLSSSSVGLGWPPNVGPPLRLPCHLHSGERCRGGAQMAAKLVDGQPSGPVVIAIDPTAPFADLFLIAAMTWPRSQREQRQSLAAWAAMALGTLEAEGVTRASAEIQAAMAEAARKHGCTVEDILADPRGAELPQGGVQFLVDHARDALRRDLFEVVGGWSTIAGAPPVEQAMMQVRRRARMEGDLVGRALSLTARMARHHPEYPASVNRVWHVIEATAAAAGRTVPSDRGPFMKMWGSGRTSLRYKLRPAYGLTEPASPPTPAPRPRRCSA